MQITYKNEKTSKKKVYYTGTDTLKAGYALCFDADATRSAETNPAITAANDTALTAANEYSERATLVEKPSTSNLANFAGVVVEEYDNKVGPCALEIYCPVTRGQKVNAHCEESTTIDSTLLTLKAGSYALGGINDGGPVVAKAMQTINRGTVAGLIQVLLVGLSHNAVEGDVVNADSRTTVQLPTAAIWRNFDLDLLRRNPFAGALYDADFRRADDMPANAYSDATANLSVNAEAVGALQLLGSADNDATEFQIPSPITVSGGKKWAFEARLKTNTVTGDDIGFFLGLLTGQELTGDLIADNGAAMIDSNHVGFQSFHADTTGIDVVYTAVGETPIIHDADVKAVTINVYTTLGMYFDGTDIRIFVDGVDTADPILAADIVESGDDFPAATLLVPTVATKNGAAEDDVVIYDWIRFAQEAN